ncbi:MAG: NAD(P)/FAD-dependent oxidoreductase, partial [Candidatus Omnitrophica bacterium]|nr:NAD(P)/FAD-dependent oxidoreductase [Candidatus Omnitrophota bacterium]
YLAKAGLKVLIVEKNDKVGGYCQSFEREGYRFDVGAHYLGSLREGNTLRKIFNDLNLDKEIKLIRSDPSDVIITKDYKIEIRNDIGQTIYNLQTNFPQQAKEIEKFLYFLTKSNRLELFLLNKNKTFREVLNSFFKDEKLKSIFCIMLGNRGLPSNLISAPAALVLYKEFILDGGYYPIGGMQSFSNALAKVFQDFGGKILLSTKVVKILVNKNVAEGIILNTNDVINAKYIVSACDARQTFLKLIGQEHLSKDFLYRLKKLIPSFSLFIVHLGLHKKMESDWYPHCGYWYFPSGEADKLYMKIHHGLIDKSQKSFFYYFCPSQDFGESKSNRTSLNLIIAVPFKTKIFWEKNKIPLANNLINRGEYSINNFSRKYVSISEITTPDNLFAYTLNYKGAVYGWASTLLQIQKLIFYNNCLFQNLYQAGHWVIQTAGQGGIPMVAFSGFSVANLILKKGV